MNKQAVVFGVTGQDGSYLSELLLDEGYDVHGVTRRSSTDTTVRLLEVKDDPNFHLVEADLLDPSSVNSVINDCQPDEIYNLAAQSFVAVSFDQPITTAQITGLGAVNLLEAIRIVNPKIRFYQASTSEMCFRFPNNLTFLSRTYFNLLERKNCEIELASSSDSLSFLLLIKYIDLD